MNNLLIQISVVIAIISAFAFLVGIIMLFFDKTRKVGLRILIVSVITFIIGFGTCLANFSLGPVH